MNTQIRVYNTKEEFINRVEYLLNNREEIKTENGQKHISFRYNGWQITLHNNRYLISVRLKSIHNIHKTLTFNVGKYHGSKEDLLNILKNFDLRNVKEEKNK